jgi:CRISPR-associated protein Csm4
MYVRYKITLLSRVITPLYSDTIFGHICWGLRYLKGEEFLQSFLKKFDSTSDPPMLISCAFPHGCLPRPVLKPFDRSLLRQLALQVADCFEALKNKDEAEKLFRGSQILKGLRKQKWITIPDWLHLRKMATLKNLVLMDIAKLEEKSEIPGFKEVVRAHNTINRKTGTVQQPGGLYFVREKWADRDSSFDVYVRFSSNEYKKLWDEVWQEYIVPTGFGKDKSTGAGQLQIEQDREDVSSLFELQGNDAWMNLSMLGFAGMPDLPGRYTVFTRFGKLGGDFAVVAPDGSKPNPFKKPMLLLEPGAVFETAQPPAGDLLSDVHVDKRIKHYALALWLPLCIGGGER